MDICFASHRYAPMVGGYENQIRLLAERLSKDFNVKVLTFNLNSNYTHESLNRVEVYRVKPQLTLFRVPLAVDYLSALGKLKYDVLHAHGFIPVVSDLSVFQAKIRNKPCVYTHHFDGNVQDSILFNRVANFYNKSIGRTCVDLADAIITTSKSYAQTSPIISDHLEKVRVIPCVVDCTYFTPQSPEKVSDLRRRLHLDGKKVVLFVGRVVPYKGVEYLIKAFGQIAEREPDFHLLIVGGQEGKRITDTSLYFQKIVRMANSDKLKGKVAFLGRVDGSELPTYYSLADVVVLPSVMRGEAFGAALLESLACGTPVVASNMPGVNEVLKGNHIVGSYVTPKDTKGLSQAITKMVYQKQKVTEHCREFAVTNYSAETIVKDYYDLYTSIAP